MSYIDQKISKSSQSNASPLQKEGGLSLELSLSILWRLTKISHKDPEDMCFVRKMICSSSAIIVGQVHR